MSSSDVQNSLISWGKEPLVMAATGQIDLNELAHQELARRGMNAKGEEVGKVAAYNDWMDAWGGQPDVQNYAWCSGCNDVLLPVGRMCKCGEVNHA